MSDLDPEVTAALAELGVDRGGTPAETESSEPIADTPDEAPQEPQAPPLDPEVQEYLSKYGGDVSQALRAAANQNSLLGRQGAELGDLRQQLEQLSQRIPQEPQQQQPALPPFNPDEFEDRIMRDPAEAARWALSTYGYNSHPHRAARAAWFEENADQAHEFYLGQVASALDAKYEQRLNEVLKQNLAPIQEQTAVQQIAVAYNGLRRDFPDLDDHAPKMYELADQYPALFQSAAQSQDPMAELDGVLRILYGAAKTLGTGGVPPTTSPSQNADAAKLAAAVSTATTAPNVNRVDPEKPDLVRMALAEIDSNTFDM